MPKGKETAIERINALEKLTKNDKKISEWIRKNYRYIPIETIATMSNKIGVSNSTVFRFVEKLGYESFSIFIKHIKNELKEEDSDSSEESDTKIKVLEKSDINSYIELNKKELDSIKDLSLNEIKKASDVIAKSKGRIYILGNGASKGLANFFYNMTSYIRSDVVFLEGDISTMPQELASITKHDVLFAITQKRFSSVTHHTVKWFDSLKSKIIILGDKDAPAAKLADIFIELPSNNSSNRIFRGRLIIFAILEIMINHIAIKLKGDLYNRVNRMEIMFEEFETFVY